MASVRIRVMSQLFQRKPIAALVSETEGKDGLKRSLRAGDLIMLAIGAVIGAGIFGAIGTAAAGQTGPHGEVIRFGAGPALVFSFLLLGGACALAGLCYAELASMIPQAGSAYAYSYATLGELVAWIIGWDLILEYAVGNVAVAISWGDYFNTLIRGLGVNFPGWITTGYRTALLSADPKIHGMIDSAPRIAGIPILINLPAFCIVMVITWLLLRGARESATANNIMVVIKLLALTLFAVVGVTHLKTANYHPFAPNGFTGIHQGAAIVFFAYIGFDAISTAAEETLNPQRNLPIGILGGLGICTLIYVIVGAVLTGMVHYSELAVADPLSRALELAGFKAVGWVVALGAVISLSAVLLVFQYGQPRIFFAMARDGLLPKWAAKIHPRTAYSLGDDAAYRNLRGAMVADRRRRRDLRSDEHRHAVRIHPGEHRRAGAPLQGTGPAAAVPGSPGLAGVHPFSGGLPVHHERASAPGLGAIRDLAGNRAGSVFRLRIQTQRLARRRPQPAAGPRPLRPGPTACAGPAPGGESFSSSSRGPCPPPAWLSEPPSCAQRASAFSVRSYR